MRKIAVNTLLTQGALDHTRLALRGRARTISPVRSGQNPDCTERQKCQGRDNDRFSTGPLSEPARLVSAG
jgi:hypothetical protein